MSREHVEMARRGYAALNEAFKTGDFLPPIEEFCDSETVLKRTHSIVRGRARCARAAWPLRP